MVSALAQAQTDTAKTDKYKPSVKPNYNYEDRTGDKLTNGSSSSPLILPDPNKVVRTVELSEDGKYYIIREKIGDIDYRPPTRMTFEQYERYKKQQDVKKYWKENSIKQDEAASNDTSSRRLIPPIYVSPKFDRIFGGNYIDIKPNGNVVLDFGGQWQRVDNPSLPVRQQRSGGFLFNQSISLNLQGKVGEKLTVAINWDTKAAFDFDNNIKLSYKGMDYDIIKTIEAGNISMPSNSSLIQGAQNLFGLKTQLQFGKLKVTAVMANQRGKNESINIPSNAGAVGSATAKEFAIPCDKYEENKHFFLSHVFRNKYEEALRSNPINSRFKITRVEVYVINKISATKNNRNFVAFADLGEASPANPNLINPSITPDPNIVALENNELVNILRNNGASLRPTGGANDVLPSFKLANAIDYEVVGNARMLELNKDYKLNEYLGYISLNMNLETNDVLAVSFEYQYGGDPNKIYRVGEFSTSLTEQGGENQALFLKLLKSSATNANSNLPIWDLMMKNVYNLGVTNISKQGFNLQVFYNDDETKLQSLTLLEGKDIQGQNLLTVFNADKINNATLADQPDNNFDYIDNITIDPQMGRIFFPVLEPFGKTLRGRFDPETEANLISKYVFDMLYRTPRANLSASVENNKIKYIIKGRAQSGNSGEISLPGLGISPNTVRVFSGANTLVQGTDYDISADGSKITLKPHVLTSGGDIRVSYEKADLFSFRQKSLIGTRFDYAVSKDVNLGATYMRLNERPLITRVNAGDEPLRNTMFGFDVNYKKDSRLLTKLIDKLPMVSTKAPSTVVFNAEYAALVPGNTKIIGEDGNSFIDDFEGSRNPFDLTRSPQRWKFAAPPTRFTNNSKPKDVEYGFKRAKLAWYNIDNSFYREGGGDRGRPGNIGKEDVDEYHYTRRIEPVEIFPNRAVQPGQINETVFDLAYFPEERGPYNYQTKLDPYGLLPNPEENFAGITRALAPGMDSDFDNLNVQYIDFWLMDPFIEPTNNGGIRTINPRTGNYETIENTTGGKLYFNLGNVSEDVLYDGLQSFENGLPVDGVKTPQNTTNSDWGVVTTQQYLVDNFSNAAGARANQDLGYDGLSSNDERSFQNYQSYISTISSAPITQSAKDKILSDVSGDDFKYYLGADQDNKKIIDRYKDYNGIENNSPDNSQSGAFTTSATNTPDNEDLNKNNTVESDESYYEYMVSIKKEDMEVGKNYIISKTISRSADGKPSTWYQFRIPLRDTAAGNVKIVGNASLKSVRFMRMYLTEFKQPIVLRMGQFQLVASQWRPQQEAFKDNKPRLVTEPPVDEGFSVSTVNIEENSSRTAISSKYSVPPGFQRDIDNTSNITRLVNEQSLRLCVDNLKGGYMRVATKDFSTSINSSGLNCLNFESLKMFLHAESANNPRATVKEDVRAVLRFGTDLTDNYYEVEVPLKLSDVTNDAQEEVWPAQNEIDVKFADLATLKAKRFAQNPNNENPQGPTKAEINGKIYRIRGNPDVSNVKFFMIGVLNPDTITELSRTFCIWADELRFSGYNKSAAQAASATANITLADLGTLQLSGKYSSVGFGGLEQKISDRSQEERISYGLVSNLLMNKFLPDKLGLKLPMTVRYNIDRSNPKYDPANPDVLLKNSSELRDNPEEYRAMVSDRTVSKGISFSDVRRTKTKPDAKKHIYDIENLSITASYGYTNYTGYRYHHRMSKNYLGQLNYAYAPQSKPIEPFKNSKLLKSKYLKLIKDFNLSPMPNALSASGVMTRFFSETQARNAQLEPGTIVFDKNWYFTRSYNARWSLTKSLSLDYIAKARAVIDEPEGRIDNTIVSGTTTKKEMVIGNLKRLGRVQDFDQSIMANYKLPLDKLPFTDWLGADVSYKASYLWTATASKATAERLGNKIQNTRDINGTGRVDFQKLYNKSKYLKKINNPPPKKEPKKKKVYRKRPDGKIDTVEVIVPEFEFGKTILRKAMTLRNISISYTQTEKLGVPGYMPTVKYFGFDDAFKAPGLPFILGSQDLERFKRDATGNGDIEKAWITKDTTLSMPLEQEKTINLKINTSIEPVKDFRITVNVDKQKQTRISENFKFIEGPDIYEELGSRRTGLYELSTIALPSAFRPNMGVAYRNASFMDFSRYRKDIKDRLDALNPSETEYNINSSQVLIPAFISAYTGVKTNRVGLTPFPNMPLPNWKVDYSGLTNIKAIKKYFPSLTISHTYTSSYKVGYTSSAQYPDQGLNNREEDYQFWQDDKTEQQLGTDSSTFIPRYQITEVQIRETFSPLLGIQAKTKSNITMGFKLNRDRTVSLQTTNAQITEMKTLEYSVNVGYSKTGLRLPFIKQKGREIVLKNMTTMRLDISLRDNSTIVRKLEEDSRPTVGQWQLQIKPAINYQYSTKLTVQLYYSRIDTRPHTSGSFRTVNTQFGVKLTFLLN